MVENSRVVSLGRNFRTRLESTTGTAAGYVRNSFVYRWLTKEPEPEVIVIDLRETRTVGPFIHLLDATVERVVPYWNESRMKRGVDRLGRGIDRTLRTRPGRVLVALLEPPEPPESERGDDEPDEPR